MKPMLTGYPNMLCYSMIAYRYITNQQFLKTLFHPIAARLNCILGRGQTKFSGERGGGKTKNFSD